MVVVDLLISNNMLSGEIPRTRISNTKNTTLFYVTTSLHMKERTRKRHGDTRFDYSIHEENKIAAESNGIILDKFCFLVLRERLAVRYGNDPNSSIL